MTRGEINDDAVVSCEASYNQSNCLHVAGPKTQRETLNHTECSVWQKERLE